MNKTAAYISLIATLFMVMYSCTSTNTYAYQVEQEEKLIKSFIKRNQINVLPLSKLPADSAWGEKDYVEIDQNLYFHLSKPGTGASIKSGDVLASRYIRYSLGMPADTTDYTNTDQTPNAPEFTFGNTSEACEAWHVAVQYMKNSGAEAKIIVPSKLGFSADKVSVTPYGYDLRVRVKP